MPVDYQAIKDALARRQQGTNTMPVAEQMGMPAGQTPMGTSPTQTVPPPQPNTPQAAAPVQMAAQAQPKGQKQPTNFDEYTKASAKALMSQLIKYL